LSRAGRSRADRPNQPRARKNALGPSCEKKPAKEKRDQRKKTALRQSSKRRDGNGFKETIRIKMCLWKEPRGAENPRKQTQSVREASGVEKGNLKRLMDKEQLESERR